MKATQPRLLQRELRRKVMAPVLAIVLVAGGLGAYGAQRLMDRVFDRWLTDAAESLASQVRFEHGSAAVNLNAAAEAVLRYDAVESVYFEVLQDGHHLLGDRDIPTHGSAMIARSTDNPYDAAFLGKPVRVAKVRVDSPQGHGVTILVAETTRKRQTASRELILMLLPLAALPLLAAAVIGFAVRSTVRPLEQIADRWNERAHASFDALPAEELPRELMPFAHALNDLLKRLQAALLRERQLAATAAHQLRTPLAGLQLSLVRASEASDLASARTILAELGRSTQRTARVLQQLLVLGRLDPQERGRLEVDPVDVVELAREVGESYLDAAIARDLELEFTSDESEAFVSANADLLAEALGNLLDNAIQYTRAGGKVRITVRKQRSQVVLAVHDSGPGIPIEERDRLFERFVRGARAPGDGSGLGLAIVRDIATMHGADVALNDSPLGGVRVTLSLPALGESASPA